MAHIHPHAGFTRTMLATILLLFKSPLVVAYDLDPNSTSSIISIAKQMGEDLVSFYDGNKPGGTPGLLPKPYYWWEAGAMMGSLIDYWYYTGDDQYNELVQQALLFQASDTNDFMPLDQRLTEGNDDQGFWGLAVMSAAEHNFPDPPSDKPQWLALAQAVFNTQASRWDTANCNGGLRWQIFDWNQGIDYKNSISQACFFALGARLALYTGNSTYADWATKTWDWMMGVGFIDENWRIIDGAHIGTNCTDHVPYLFTYNAGGFILGAAAMYNHTEDPAWKSRLDNLLDASKVFFTGSDNDIMTEVACEPVDRCNLDQQSFKAYLSRWLAATTKFAPHTYDYVMPYLRASAVAAAKQCVGGSNQRMCGLKWNQDKYDGSTGVGQQMAAMEVTLGCMILDRPPPVTHDTGGTSQGDPGAGGDDIGQFTPHERKTIGGGDRAGAAILTMLVLSVFVGGISWIFVDEMSSKPPLEQFKSFQRKALVAVAVTANGAAARYRKEGGQSINEKAGGSLSVVDGLSSMQSSALSVQEHNRAVESSQIRISRVRSTSLGAQKRLSNMPIGWPRQNYEYTGTRHSVFEEPRGRRGSIFGDAAERPSSTMQPVRSSWSAGNTS